MKITNSVYLLSGGYYGTMGNVYAIKDGSCIILIDSGRCEHRDVILESMSYWGLDADDVKYVLLTHAHHDHAGGAKYFQEKGAKIICGSKDTETLTAGGYSTDVFPVEGHDFPACEPDREIVGDGQLILGNCRIDHYEVPGHTPGSMIYSYDDGAKSIFFTGDFVSCDGIEGEDAITAWTGDLKYDGQAYLRSAKKMFRYTPDMVLGGHGIPCVSGGGRVLRKVYEKLLESR